MHNSIWIRSLSYLKYFNFEKVLGNRLCGGLRDDWNYGCSLGPNLRDRPFSVGAHYVHQYFDSDKQSDHVFRTLFSLRNDFWIYGKSASRETVEALTRVTIMEV